MGMPFARRSVFANQCRLPPLVLALLLLVACGAVHAALDAATQRQVAGVYSNACGDREQLMLRLYGDVLDIERGAMVVKARALRVSRKAPPGSASLDFKASVRAEVKGGEMVALVLSHNTKGLFARIDAGPEALAPLGPGVIGQVLRHCDPNRNTLPGAAPPFHQGPTDLLRDAGFKAAYAKALGPLASERWLARLDGPAPELRRVPLGGIEYVLLAACKQHDCADHNTVLLWQPKSRLVFGLVFQVGRSTLLGSPPPDMVRELQALWHAEWRR